jgi:uncharacterized protein (DUF1330 family)
MYQLIYYSTASAALTKDDIEDILNQARTFNAANDISGCLLFHEGFFLQILEGDETVVKELFEKIKKDTRHTGVKFLVDGETTERAFNKWRMAYRELDANDLDEISKMLLDENLVSLSEVTDNPTHATRIFWHMAQEFLKG